MSWRAFSVISVVCQVVGGVVSEPLIGAAPGPGGSQGSRPGAFGPGASAAGLRVPLAFVENRGQWEAGVSFAAYRLGATAILRREGIDLAARGEPGSASGRVRLHFDGTVGAAPRAEDPIDTTYHFLSGSSPATRRAGVPGYRSILYEDLYPGISLRVRGSEAIDAAACLSYDVILEPGAPIEAFGMRCEGIDRLEVHPDGSLVLTGGGATVRQPAPVAWQELPTGERRPVDARFRARDACRFGFEVAGRDPALPCVIDPAVQFGTHYGGPGEDFAFDVLADGSGNVLAVGFSSGTALGGRYDAFVAVFDPALAQLRALTVLGGSGDDRATTAALVPGGNLLVGGWTTSSNFPTSESAPDKKWSGAGDGFVTVLEPLQGTIVFSTYVGGTLDDAVTSVAVDAEGRIVGGGYTFSQSPSSWFDPPAAGGYQMARSGESDVFLCRLDIRPGNEGVVPADYFTLLGGSGLESRTGEYFDDSRIELRRNVPKIAMLPDGTIAIAGDTYSANFPMTPSSYQSSLRGSGDIFVARIRPDASLPAAEQLVYATYLGGWDTCCDDLLGMDADPSGNIWLTGYTWSPTYPTTPNAAQSVNRGQDDVIVACLTPDPALPPAEQLKYSSYVGGTSYEWGHDIAVGPDGSVIIVGESESGDIPLSEPAISTGLIVQLKPEEGQGPFDLEIAHVARTGASFTVLTGVHPAPGGGYHVAGYTSGTMSSLPAGGYQPQSKGSYDALVLGVDMRLPVPRCTVTPESGRVPLEVSADATASEGGHGTSIKSYRWDFGDGSSAEGARVTHTYTMPGRHVVTLTITTDIGSWDSTTAVVYASCGAGDSGPWTGTDIGSPWLLGASEWSESPEAGCLRVCAAGKLIGGLSDSLHFVHRTAPDGFVLTARLDDAQAAVAAQVGLMARAGMEADASFAAITFRPVTSGGRVRFQSRDGAGSTTHSDTVFNVTLPVWLRLTRSEETMVGEFSQDGTAWQVASAVTFENEIPLARDLAAGIVAIHLEPTANVSVKPIHATLCDIRLEPIAAAGRFIRGDADADGVTNITDAVAILGFLFLGDPMNPCKDAADVNDDGTLDISDPVRLLGHLFLGSAEPPAPFGACGSDPTDDELDCSTFEACP